MFLKYSKVRDTIIGKGGPMTEKVDNLRTLPLMSREAGIKETDRSEVILLPPNEADLTKSELKERLIRWIDAVNR
jgi:hypothetical protein